MKTTNNNYIKIFTLDASAILIFAFFILMTAIIPAKADTPADFIANQLKATFQNTTFTNIGTTTVDGIWQAEISNEVVYFSPTAEVMIFGQMYNKNGINLTDQAKQIWQGNRINKLDISDALIIGGGSITIIEFSDPDCPFCKSFDSWVNNRSDITRKIIFTPIASLHPNAHKDAVHILCSDDKALALKQIFNNEIDYKDMLGCKAGRELLIKHQAIAKAFGVSATPTLIINGILIQGFNKAKIEQLINNIKQGGITN